MKTTLGTGLECCYCYEVSPINDDNPANMFDVHEIILSRGDIMGTPPNMILEIMDEHNCGWIHRKCHQFAEGGNGRLRGILYLMRYEGVTAVKEWCRKMNEQLLQTSFMNDIILVEEFMSAGLKEIADVQYPRHSR